MPFEDLDGSEIYILGKNYKITSAIDVAPLELELREMDGSYKELKLKDGN